MLNNLADLVDGYLNKTISPFDFDTACQDAGFSQSQIDCAFKAAATAEAYDTLCI